MTAAMCSEGEASSESDTESIGSNRSMKKKNTTNQQQVCGLCDHVCKPVTQICVCKVPESSELTLECGHKLPIINCCMRQKQEGNMPVVKGFIGNQVVDVLRDTGCSSVVIKAALVNERQYTGEIQRCIFIDGSVHTFPMAEVYLDTPYFSGHTKAIVIEDPLYPVIIGNVVGVKMEGILQGCQNDKDRKGRFNGKIIANNGSNPCKEKNQIKKS